MIMTKEESDAFEASQIRYYKGKYKVKVLGKKEYSFKWNWIVKALEPFDLNYGGICTWHIAIGETCEVFPHTLFINQKETKGEKTK